ncbi:hypothetical protein [Streptomyces sp. NBC_01565]|uniref:hypothetical protein n=1 Tax=unclassified Streptomyces TaxID=2593676 RepID=UPI002256B405|nr:hypothetical protein [Streptomyces sp. NBC_01565]MCX4545633.1 hypothetical protein [Streptomyces sp. NBC_01565]
MTDMWQGRALSDAHPVSGDADEIYYRIHAADDGELLAYGTASGDALQGVVESFQEVQGRHPGRRLVIRQYDRPA